MKAIIDTGATCSAISSNFVRGKVIDCHDAIPVKVGNGEIIHALGSTTMDIEIGNTRINQRMLVLDTDAFDCILGLDFMQHPEINGILMRPPRLMVNNQEVPLHQDCLANCVRILLFRTENYKLLPYIRNEVFSQLGINSLDVIVDLFASRENNQEALFCSKSNSAWSYDWGKLHKSDKDYLWANPPFSKLLLAITKVCVDQARVILVTPDWGDTGDVGRWRRLLDRLTIDRVEVSTGVPIFKKDKMDIPMPPPPWTTIVSILDGKQNQIRVSELDPIIVNKLSRMNKGKGLKELQENVAKENWDREKKVPQEDRPIFHDNKDEEIQTSIGESFEGSIFPGTITPCEVRDISQGNVESISNDSTLADLCEEIEKCVCIFQESTQ